MTAPADRLDLAALGRVADALFAAGLEPSSDVCRAVAHMAAAIAVDVSIPREQLLELVSAFYDQASERLSKHRATQEGLAL